MNCIWVNTLVGLGYVLGEKASFSYYSAMCISFLFHLLSFGAFSSMATASGYLILTDNYFCNFGAAVDIIGKKVVMMDKHPPFALYHLLL